MTGIVTYHVVICFGGDNIEEISLATSIDNEPLGRISIVRHWWEWADVNMPLLVTPRRKCQCQSNKNQRQESISQTLHCDLAVAFSAANIHFFH